MAEDIPCDPKLWQTFVIQHHLGHHEQADFLEYLRHPRRLPIASVPDLEEEYLNFLGNPEEEPPHGEPCD